MPTYRVIFFTPQPGRGWQIPVAAVTAGREGSQVVLAESQPDAGCSGGPMAHFLLERGREILQASEPSIVALPPSLTDNFQLGTEFQIPTGVQEAAAWLLENVLPSTRGRTGEHTKFKQARTQGRAFFRAQEIDKYVVDRFKFANHFKLGPALAGAAETVTHWVDRKDGTKLLMEPIASSGDLRRQVQRVFNRYSGLLRLADQAGASEQIETLAYVLPRALPAGEEYRLSALLDVARVVDVSNPAQRIDFVSEIRTHGISHEEPMLH